MYFNPVTLYRVYSKLHRSALTRILSRPIEMLNFMIFHAVVPATAKIGRGTTFHHRGIGVVIHPRAIIGEDCVVMHGVTVGGRNNRKRGDRTCPTIGNAVVIGAGAKVLGPIEVGDGAQIGANAVVLTDVPAGGLAVGVPARVTVRS